MSTDWIDLTPDTRPTYGADKPPVRFGMTLAKKGTSRGRILLTKEILAKLGVTGPTPRVNIRRGNATNAHRICIIPAGDGQFQLGAAGKPNTEKKDGSVYRVLLPVIKEWPTIAIPMKAAEHEIGRIGAQPVLFVDLPPALWLRSRR